MSHTDMLDTILDNHKAIQQSKYLYFEYLRQEKVLKQLWQSCLEDNEHLEQGNTTLLREIQGQQKELNTNQRDHAARLTEQRLHMLKCLHYMP